MPLKFKNTNPARLIIALILLNILLFAGSSLYFDTVSYQKSNEGVEVKDKDYLESGWKIVNWSLDMLKYFKDSNPKN